MYPYTHNIYIYIYIYIHRERGRERERERERERGHYSIGPPPMSTPGLAGPGPEAHGRRQAAAEDSEGLGRFPGAQVGTTVKYRRPFKGP